MAARGTILDATLFVYSPAGRHGQAEWAAAVTSLSRELGVRNAGGTDGLIGSEQRSCRTCTASWGCSSNGQV